MRSLAPKLTLAFLVVSLISVVVVALLAGRRTTSAFNSFVISQSQAALLTRLEDYYQANQGWSGVDRVLLARGMHGGGPHVPGGQFVLANPAGVVLVGGLGFRPGGQLPPAALEESLPVAVDGEVVGRLITGRGPAGPADSGAAFLASFRQNLLQGAAVATGVALVLGLLLARSLTRPLRELTSATRAIAEGHLEQSVPVRSQDELGELATSFNQMSADLVRSRNLRRQMTADIAHDLRTPLSIILGHAEALHDGVLPATADTLAIIHDEARRLSRLVGDLRTLSLSEAGELDMHPARISPHRLLERAISTHSAAAQQKGVSLCEDFDAGLPVVNVDPDRMAQVLDNLLANALRYTPPDGRIVLAAQPGAAGVRLSIRDSGPGIPAEELPFVFERFYRGDRARQRHAGGSGLGLAIARAIVEAHGGRIWAENGGQPGATFVVELPG